MKRLGVSLHHEVGLDPQSEAYVFKELWGSYIATVLTPLFDEVDVSAKVSVLKSCGANFQTYCLADAKVFVNGHSSLARGLPSPTAHLVGRWGVTRDLWRSVRESDVMLLYMPCWRSVLASAMCVVHRTPYWSYQGGHFALPGQSRVRAAGRRLAQRFVSRHAAFVIVAGRELHYMASRVQDFVYETVPVTGLSQEAIVNTHHAFSGTPQASLLYVGSLSPLKRVEDLLLAIVELHRRGRQVRATIVGPGDSSSLRLLAEEHHISDQVEFVPYVKNGPNLYRLYAQADAFVLPSLTEGFPRVIYEAMAAGTPVITTPVGGVPHVLSDRRDCLMCGFRDPESIADCVDQLADEPDLARSLVTNGRSFISAVLEHDPRTQLQALLHKHFSGRVARLAVVTNRFAPYRVSLFTDLVNDPDLATVLVATDHDSPTPAQLTHACLRGPAPLRYVTLGLRLWRMRPHTVLCSGLGPFALVASTLAHWRNAEFWVWWGGTRLSEKRSGRARGLMRRYLVPRAAGFLAYGEDARDHLQSMGVPREEIVTLGNLTIDVEEFEARVTQGRPRRFKTLEGLGLRHDSVTLLAVGQLIPRKNYETLLKAIERLHAAGVMGFQAVLVGDGPLRASLEARILKLDNVVLVPRVAWEDMPDIYAATDIFVHPAYLDQWPQVVSEAAASGLAIVATSQSGLGGFLHDGVEGFIVDAHDELDLAARLGALIEHSDERQRLGQSAHEAAQALGSRHALAIVKRLAERCGVTEPMGRQPRSWTGL